MSDAAIDIVFIVIEEEQTKAEEEEWKPYVPPSPSAILHGYYSKDEPGQSVSVCI